MTELATPVEPPWLTIARAEVGVKERAGKEHNPRILQYLASTTLPTALRVLDETPWCSAFTNWCMQQAGYVGTGKANARSWLNWGERLEQPKRGCVVVLWRAMPSGTQGHVAFWLGEANNHVTLLGGNQSNAVCIQPYPKHRVLSYRWPAATSLRRS